MTLQACNLVSKQPYFNRAYVVVTAVSKKETSKSIFFKDNFLKTLDLFANFLYFLARKNNLGSKKIINLTN